MMIKKFDKSLASHHSNSPSLKILAIDTSLNGCSVALMMENKIYEHYQLAPKQQASLILSMIKSLLTEKNLPLKNLDLLTFACGPGSFTGTRIAAGVIQGLAIGANLPAIPVSTLQIMAQKCWREYSANHVMVCLDARMQEIYWGVYQLNDQQIMQSVIPDTLCFPADLPEIFHYQNQNDYFAIGTGWDLYPELLQKQLSYKPNNILPNFQPSAQDIIPLAAHKFLQEKNFVPENAVPVYLRDTGIWKKITEQ